MTVYNRKEYTLKCLEKIYNQDLSDCSFKIYMTNDGCTDGTPEAVKLLYPQVCVIDGDGTLYWNRGMHKAWSEAIKKDHDFYLWINDDTFIYSNTIYSLLKESEKYGNRAIIVGSTCAVNQKDKITYGGWWRSKLITDLSKPNSCEMMNGNLVLIPRYVYNIVGINDPYYRHSLGDFDYCINARNKGVSVFTAVGVMGECEDDNNPLWKDPKVPFLKRWYSLWSPKGANPQELFYFKKKNCGVASACFSFISNILHVLLPKLWTIGE